MTTGEIDGAKRTETFVELLRQAPGLQRLSDEQLLKCAHIAQLLTKAAQEYNLTTIRSPQEIALYHFADSLAALDAHPPLLQTREACDIGTGAGFPLFPLAVALPQCSWSGIESVAKKCHFIENTAAALALDNVSAMCARAEEMGHGGWRERFEVATARAVGPVASLLEVTLPLVRIGGVFLMWKTHAAAQEFDDSANVVEMLGGEPLTAHYYRFDGDLRDRVIYRIAKRQPTPERFPRGTGKPFRRPLA